MAINVIRFEYRKSPHWGILVGEHIVALLDAGDDVGVLSTGQLIERYPSVELRRIADQRGDSRIPLNDVRLLSPVTANQQFICLGANYRQHMIESGMNPAHKTYNMVFTKAQSSMAPADTDLIKPRCVRFLDYEVELGLILKRPVQAAVQVTEHNLHEFIAGLTIVNDYSARDIQIPQMQFYKGKSFRTFGPIGPYLCLLDPDEMHYLQDMELQLRVNGELRQHDSSANLVWGAAQTLTELSGVHDLAPGDLIATGTPAGCALAVPSPAKQRIAALLPERIKWQLFLKAQQARPQYLQAGDLVEASIRSRDAAIDLGTQRNRVVNEA
jgi:2,4-didehydro-3-deoxy-L-rhamnonate hydrolase